MPPTRRAAAETPSEYRSHQPHRNRSPQKSQWCITEAEETQSFRLASEKEWLGGTHGWGLHFIEDRPDYLGTAQDHTTRLFVAKYVRSATADSWHGYPADHQRHPQDIPSEKVSTKWSQESYLSPAKIRKLIKGQPCSL